MVLVGLSGGTYPAGRGEEKHEREGGQQQRDEGNAEQLDERVLVTHPGDTAVPQADELPLAGRVSDKLKTNERKYMLLYDMSAQINAHLCCVRLTRFCW